MEEWTVEVIRSGYPISFHHLPPLTWDRNPFLQFMACEGSDTLRRSGQDAGEGCFGAGYYSRLILVQMSGRWRPVVDLSSLNNFLTNQLQYGEIVKKHDFSMVFPVKFQKLVSLSNLHEVLKK